MNKDLTVGKPSQVLWQFCLPMFGSIIFQQLYNIADSLVAGKFIGENGRWLRNHLLSPGCFLQILRWERLRPVLLPNDSWQGPHS